MKSEPAAGDEPTAETESESEAELSGFSPVVRAQQTYTGASPSSLWHLENHRWYEYSHTGKQYTSKSLQNPREEAYLFDEYLFEDCLITSLVIKNSELVRQDGRSQASATS